MGRFCHRVSVECMVGERSRRVSVECTQGGGGAGSCRQVRVECIGVGWGEGRRRVSVERMG
eukprot:359841-Chlamydomonas_euryale.AAC.9